MWGDLDGPTKMLAAALAGGAVVYFLLGTSKQSKPAKSPRLPVVGGSMGQDGLSPRPGARRPSTSSTNSYTYSEAFLRAIPKTDLHVHLDGSIRIETLIELAARYGVELPVNDVEGLKQTVFKKEYKDLNEYLKGFQYTTAVMQTREALERVAYEFAVDNFSEEVHYFEVRFAPQLHASVVVADNSTGDALDVTAVLKAVNAGLKRASDEFNSLPEVVNETVPRYEYGIIVCAMRMWMEFFSPYFKAFSDIHKYETKERQYGLASMALITAAVAARDDPKDPLPIVALDLAGAEQDHEAKEHKEAYDYAHRKFLNKTVHAGEAFGPESIFQALQDCHADRVGHGTNLFSDHMVIDPKHSGTQESKVRYVEMLAEHVAATRTTLEVCLTSNLQTMPELRQPGAMANHPLRKMLERQMSVSICTDNRLVSSTTVTDEFILATQTMDITPKQLKDMVIGSFKRSFFPDVYKSKRRFVRSIINYYEAVERKFEIDSGVSPPVPESPRRPNMPVTSASELKL